MTEPSFPGAQPRKSTLTTRTMLQVESATRCLSCETPLRLIEVWPGNWQCHCPNCYDDTPDSPAVQQVSGFGATPDESLWAWTEAWELATDQGFFPSETLLELEKQVAAEAARQRGWSWYFNPEIEAAPVHPMPCWHGPAQGS
jgi:hypothetical protein